MLHARTRDISPTRYPVTCAVSLAAVLFSCAWWLGLDVGPFVEDVRMWFAEPWRIVTSTFLHVDLVHLVFNLYWFSLFGVAIEAALGWRAFGIIMLIFGIGSGMAEFAVFEGGVGLSGAVYGLFGFLWMTGRFDRRFEGLVTPMVVALFAGWLVLCVVLTEARIMRVANVAHTAGLALGGILGLAVSERAALRRLWLGVLSALTILFALGAGPLRPWINQSESLAYDLGFRASVAAEQAEDARAAEYLRRAARVQVVDSNLREFLGDLCSVLAYRAFERGEYEESAALYALASRRDRNAIHNYNLGLVLERIGRPSEARQAYERALEIQPHHEDTLRAIRRLDAE